MPIIRLSEYLKVSNDLPNFSLFLLENFGQIFSL